MSDVAGTSSFARPYLRLSPQEKWQVLASFIHQMTVAVRAFYLLDPLQAAEKLKSWNELLHRVAGNLDAMLGDSDERYPDEVLMTIIEGAADGGLRDEIAWAWQRSCEAVIRRRDRAKSPRSAKPAPAH